MHNFVFEVEKRNTEFKFRFYESQLLKTIDKLYVSIDGRFKGKIQKPWFEIWIKNHICHVFQIWCYDVAMYQMYMWPLY